MGLAIVLELLELRLWAVQRWSESYTGVRNFKFWVCIASFDILSVTIQFKKSCYRSPLLQGHLHFFTKQYPSIFKNKKKWEIIPLFYII